MDEATRRIDVEPVRFARGQTCKGPDNTYPDKPWLRPVVFCVQFRNNPTPTSLGTLSARKTFAESLSTLYYAEGAEVVLVKIGGQWRLP